MIVLNKLATVLRGIGSIECLERAILLESIGHTFVTLNLRSLNLKPNDIIAIVDILKQACTTHNNSIKSISFSYNTQMGDLGAIALAKNLPASLSEIGLVDCGICDKGGYEILNWMTSASHLEMVCIEQNDFSESLKKEFKRFKSLNPRIVVEV